MNCWQRRGYLADRISVNLELPTEEGLRTLATEQDHAEYFESDGKSPKHNCISQDGDWKSLHIWSVAVEINF